jgi:DNA-binding PucR family transcriptional regulator
VSESDHFWLRLLQPGDPDALRHSASSPELIAELCARVGSGAVGWAVEHSGRIAANFAEQTDERPRDFDPRIAEQMVLGAIMHLGGHAELPATLVREAVLTIREAVPRGLSVDLGMRGSQRVCAAIVRELFEFCEMTVPPEQQVAAMRQISGAMFRGLDDLFAMFIREFAAERERWLAGRAAARLELVRSVLSGAEVDTRRLGYDLSLRHIALVLWHGDATAQLADVATTLLEQAGCLAQLVIPLGTTEVWAWGGRPRDRPVRPDGPVPAGVGVAVGLPGDGVEGFGRSHRQAFDAQRIAQLRPGASGLYDYDAVELVALLGSDHTVAADFVGRQLGELAADTESAAELRATVKCYLDHDRGVSAAAEQLHVAKNTVLYRVRRAGQLRGRPVNEDRLRLHVALELVEACGVPVAADGETPRAAHR